MGQETNSRCQPNSDKPILAISWLTSRYQLFAVGAPLMDKPHILASAAETGFYNLKSKFPLSVKLKYQGFNVKGRPFD